jgi:hypothetical protein
MSWLGAFAPLSLMILFYILAKLSERFGSVVKMRPIYRHYYTATLFLALGTAAHFLATLALTSTDLPAWFASPWFLLLAHNLPLAIGVTIGLFITWRYWSWLVTERHE